MSSSPSIRPYDKGLKEERGYLDPADALGTGDTNTALVSTTVDDGIWSVAINGTLTGSAQDLTAGIWWTFDMKDVYGKDVTKSLRSFTGSINLIDIPENFIDANGCIFIGISNGSTVTNLEYELLGSKFVANYPRGAVFDGSDATPVIVSGGTADMNDSPMHGTFMFTMDGITGGPEPRSQTYAQGARAAAINDGLRSRPLDIRSTIYTDPKVVVGIMSDNTAINTTIKFIPEYQATQINYNSRWRTWTGRDKPWTIAFIGDSITAGTGGEPQYRMFVERAFRAIAPGRDTYKAVGSNNSGFNIGGYGAPTYEETLHDGTGGWTANSANTNKATVISGWSETPDICVIMLGTNLSINASTYQTDMQAVVDAVFAAGVEHVLVVKPPPRADDGPSDALLVLQNATIDNLTGGILVADTYTGYNTGSWFQVDNVHPNGLGNEFIGNTIVTALTSVVAGL